MGSNVSDMEKRHMLDDKDHTYDDPEPGFSKVPKLPPEAEGTESLIHTVVSWSILPFIMILLVIGFASIYYYTRQPTRLTAFLSTYIFFWLMTTFIFSMVIKNFLELWVDYHDYAYVDKNSTRVMAVSFILSSIALVAELFFFLEYHLYLRGYFYIGLLVVMVYILTFYSIMAIFYTTSTAKIVYLGIALGIIAVLFAASSRFILINLLEKTIS